MAVRVACGLWVATMPFIDIAGERPGSSKSRKIVSSQLRAASWACIKSHIIRGPGREGRQCRKLIEGARGRTAGPIVSNRHRAPAGTHSPDVPRHLTALILYLEPSHEQR